MSARDVDPAGHDQATGFGSPVVVSARRGGPFETATIPNRTAHGVYACVEIRPQAVRTSYTLRVTRHARP